jgi:hypothetical protein
MEKSIISIIFGLLLLFVLGGGGMAASNAGLNIDPPSPNEVLIGPNGVIMPLGKILLIRKDSDYGAIKFSKFWTGKTEDDLYAKYEAYYQDDKTGDFHNQKIKFSQGELHSPKPIFSLFGHPFAFGIKEEIKCGPIRLWWTGKGAAYFFGRDQRQGDYGIELAPTPWTEIPQINVFDSRVKWYRYDEQRARVNIIIDKLWDGGK